MVQPFFYSIEIAGWCDMKKRRGMAAAFFSNFIFGFSFLFSKVALEFAAPSVLLAARFVFALILLQVLIWLFHIPVKLKGKPVKELVYMGLFQPVVYFLCESYGIRYSSSTFAAVMIALVPVVSLGVAAAVLKERPNAAQVLCCLLSIGGVVWMAFLQNQAGRTTIWGILLLLGAVLSAVGFNLFSRRLSVQFTAIERTYVMFALAAAVFTILAAAENWRTPDALLQPFRSPVFWASLVYLGGFSSVGAFVLIHYANTCLPVAQSTVFSNVITVVSLFAGAFFLHEPLGVYSVLASAMIILGIWGVQRAAAYSDSV